MVKICFLGAGSTVFARSVLGDCISVPSMRDAEITLVDIDAENNIVPRLATEWSMNDDGREYTFTLAEGVLFHDGTPLRPEDVVWTFDRLRDPEGGLPTADLYAGIEAIELGLAPSGRIEARRSVLRWRDAASGPSVGAPGASDTEPAFIAALGGIGEPLASFASRDGDTANLTRAWLAPGDVPTASRQVERAAVRHGLSTLLRFDAPPDAPASLRGGRVLAFAGQGAAVVVTLNPHAAGAAVVVHFQERRP